MGGKIRRPELRETAVQELPQNPKDKVDVA